MSLIPFEIDQEKVIMQKEKNKKDRCKRFWYNGIHMQKGFSYFNLDMPTKKQNNQEIGKKKKQR